MNTKIRINKFIFSIFLIFTIFFSVLFSFIIFSGLKMVESLSVTPVYAEEEKNYQTASFSEEFVIPNYVEVEVKNVINPYSLRKIGEFKLTAYCPCVICCEKWASPPEGKISAIGVGEYQGVTFAVDPKVIPYGTKLYIDGVGVGIATDCGGAIKGNRIDVYFANHQDALNFGVGGGYAHEVYIIE